MKPNNPNCRKFATCGKYNYLAALDLFTNPIAMSRNYYFQDQTVPHYISFATVYWLDVLT